MQTQSGVSIINGNWVIDRPGIFTAVGTQFTYRRPNEIRSRIGESITAPGPLTDDLHVYVRWNWRWHQPHSLHMSLFQMHKYCKLTTTWTTIYTCHHIPQICLSVSSPVDLPATSSQCILWVQLAFTKHASHSKAWSTFWYSASEWVHTLTCIKHICTTI